MKKQFTAPSIEIKKANLNAFLITASIQVSDTPTGATAPEEVKLQNIGHSTSSAW